MTQERPTGMILENLSVFLSQYRLGVFETNSDAIECIHAVINEMDAARAVGLLLSDTPSITDLRDELSELEADAIEFAMPDRREHRS